MKYELAFLEQSNCAAVFAEGKLCEYYPPDIAKVQSGDIYIAKVERIVVGLQAAFVDLGIEKGFIYAKEVIKDGVVGNNCDIRSLLKVGQEIIVQVVKEAIGDKRPTLTMKISLPGRYAVFLPNCEQRSVSRKITDEKLRDEMQKELQNLKLAANTGIILRTGAGKADSTAWQQDYDKLLAKWQSISSAKNGRLLYKAASLPEALLRDLSNDVTAIWTDDENVYEMLAEINTEKTPVFWRDTDYLIKKFHLEMQLKAAWQRKIALPSGGYLIIEETEAMVVIDVNSGTFSASDTEDTFTEVNIEAAKEIARQIRLRNLGGIIIIDFVDMKNDSSREKVRQALADAISADRLKVSLEGWSALGLFELTRQKKGQPLSKYLSTECDNCRGLGKIYRHML